MTGWEKYLRTLWVLFLVGASAIALAVSVGSRTSPTLEIDSNYRAAVTSQSKVEPLAFIRTFSSSDLVGTLIAVAEAGGGAAGLRRSAGRRSAQGARSLRKAPRRRSLLKPLQRLQRWARLPASPWSTRYRLVQTRP